MKGKRRKRLAKPVTPSVPSSSNHPASGVCAPSSKQPLKLSKPVERAFEARRANPLAAFTRLEFGSASPGQRSGRAAFVTDSPLRASTLLQKKKEKPGGIPRKSAVESLERA
ncbi:hypothetical protein KM043_003574 [Ampulex compressa]|nr:hypothetical protein KM043_003574 [Ampulex compressa]